MLQRDIWTMNARQKNLYLGPKELSAVAVLACVFNVVTVVGINYQKYVSTINISHQQASILINFPTFVSECIWFFPMFVVVIARRIAPIVVSYASILFIIMVREIYLLLPPRLTGVDALTLKYDWSDLCLDFLGILSGAAIAVWVIVRLVMVFSSIPKLLRGTR